MDYNPRGNEFGSMLRESPEIRAMLEAKANEVAALYRARVAKRTGELAADVTVSTEIGGMKHDRRIATVTVNAPYAASHEFGTSRQKGYHELQQALEAVKDT